jgi:hypothetical protein
VIQSQIDGTKRIIVRNDDKLVSMTTEYQRYSFQQETFNLWLSLTVGLTTSSVSSSIDLLFSTSESQLFSLQSDTKRVIFGFLSSDAIVVSSAGTYPKSGHDNFPFSNKDSRLTTISALSEKYDFQKVIEYSEFIPGVDLWSSNHHRFSILIKDRLVLSNWIATDAEINVSIRKEVLSSLQFFDGGTMNRYIFPSRIAEDMYCNDITHPTESCHLKSSYDPYVENVPISNFEVRISDVENGGRGVFALSDIQVGSYIGSDELAYGLLVLPNSYSLLSDGSDHFENISNLYASVYWGFLEAYTWVEFRFVSVNGSVQTIVKPLPWNESFVIWFKSH